MEEVLLMLLGVMVAGLHAERLVVLHSPSTVPEGWLATDEVVEDSMRLSVILGLKRSNVEELDRLARVVSDPRSERYLDYPTYRQLGDLVRPAERHCAAVRRWLESHGVEGAAIREHPHGDYMHAHLTVGQLEGLTRGEFVVYRHTTGVKAVRMTSAVQVPQGVAEALDVITGFNTFPVVRPNRGVHNDGTVPGVYPALLRATYGITPVPPPPPPHRNIQAFLQLGYLNASDLPVFCNEYLNQTCGIERFVGRNYNESGCDESALDAEYLLAAGNLTSTWVYTPTASDFCSGLLEFGSVVTNESTHAFTISISYASQKIGYCHPQQMDRFAQDVQKMGVMGITTVIGSGDDGSGGETRLGSNQGKLSPGYPASVPYALAVGGTRFVGMDKGVWSGEEGATEYFGSGGGFSWEYDIPEYQRSAVSGYLSKVAKPNATYAPNGRGTPDVSLLATDYQVILNGWKEPIYGTSASTPVFAGIITLLNNACLAESGKPLGFVNPLFYLHPAIFTDITKGTNAIGENRKAGWPAEEGWDACTGLGTPDFPKMLSVVKALCAKAAKA